VQDVLDTVAAVWPGGVVRIDELNRDAAVSAASYDGAPARCSASVGPHRAGRVHKRVYSL
jgi:hypothetical protein